MSTKTQTKKTKALQAFAFVVLALALILSALTLVLRSALTGAEAEKAVPSIFGQQIIPVSGDKFESIGVDQNSLVVLQAIGEEPVNVGDVVVFDTPIGFIDNSAYGTFSMGIITEMETDTGAVLYTIQGLGQNGDTTVDAATVRGIADTQIAMLGGMFSSIAAGTGVIYFIVCPLFAYIAVQLLVVVIRVLSSKPDEEDDEDDDAVPVRVQAEGKSVSSIKSATPQTEDLQKYEGLKQGNTTPLPTGRVSGNTEPLKLQFDKKKTAKSVVDVKSQTFTTSMSKQTGNVTAKPTSPAPDGDEISAMLLASMKGQPKATTAPTKEAEDAKVASTEESVNPVFGLLDEQRSPARSDEFRSVLDMVDDMLSEIKQEQAQEAAAAPTKVVVQEEQSADLAEVEAIIRESEQQATQEFNLSSLHTEKEKQADFVRDENSQQILDNILIELKDNALNVQFDNVKSQAVDIEKTTGQGFTIDTPKYKANVNITLDKKKKSE